MIISSVVFQQPKKTQVSQESFQFIKTMAFYTYILESVRTKRIYISQTNDIVGALARHNDGLEPSTKAHRPWVLLHTVCFESRAESMQLEKELKAFDNHRMVREWIEEQE